MSSSDLCLIDLSLSPHHNRIDLPRDVALQNAEAPGVVRGHRKRSRGFSAATDRAAQASGRVFQ